MSLEISGKLIKILPEQTGSGKNGTWVKQEFVIETAEQYPKKICCAAWGDKAAQVKTLALGDLLKVSFNVESREYNERWYTELRAWKIDGQGAGSADTANTETPKTEKNFPGDITTFSSDESGDDLPF